MMLVDLAPSDIELVEMAKSLIGRRKSSISSVASVLRTRSNRVFYGVNIFIEASSSCSICAEYAAIGTMFSEGEKEIETIVAVTVHGRKDFDVIPPCGKCRQFISEFGNAYVIIEEGDRLGKTKLSELYPLPAISEPDA